MHAKIFYGSNCLEVIRKIAKSQKVDLENKGQGYLRLTEVRWPNVPCWFANTCQNHVSKFFQFEEITNSEISVVCP